MYSYLNSKVILYVCCFLIISHNGFSQTFVPDDNFEQALIDLGYDSGPLDDVVPTANISTITTLDVNSKNISDLSGIEDFLGLTVLNCSNNLLSNLDVNNNTNLTQLFCNNNTISTLDISILLNLQILWCDNNQLTRINVDNNTNLISLVCGNNLLTRLNVTNNPLLNVLAFEFNQITRIDVSNNPTLNTFNCSHNTISSLDITNNLNLVNFNCSLNQINSINTSNNHLLNNINISNNQLSELDLSQNQRLKEINCSQNNLCHLIITNGNNTAIDVLDFSNNPNLNCVVVDNPSVNYTGWSPLSFTNYVGSINDCNIFVNVDSLPNFVGTSYILPTLTYGRFFTKSGGEGVELFPGQTINNSQTIYIYNETVCDSNERIFNLLITTESYYIPKYFTPNNDGNHDVWMVQDFSNTIKSISIFNHYGKLLKYLQPNDVGWNGTYNGQPMETNDYWYVITFTTGDTKKGHFTLKR